MVYLRSPKGLRQVGFIKSVCLSIPHLLHALDLFLSPLVKVNRFYPGYVHPEIPVDSSTSNADEHTNVPGGPSWPFRLAVRTKLVILLQQQVGQDCLVPIHVLHRFARHGQGAGGGRGRRALLAPRNPCLSPEVRTPGPRPRAPPENEGALSPCAVQRPFSSQPRLPPNSAAPLRAAPPGGLRERPRSQRGCRTRQDPRPRQQGRSGLLLLPGAETTPGPACQRATAPAPRFPWQLPPALPPPRPPNRMEFIKAL